MRGFLFDGHNVTGELIQLGPLPTSRPLTVILDRDALKDGTQTLDNIRWQNVLFVGMQIIYKGGGIRVNKCDVR